MIQQIRNFGLSCECHQPGIGLQGRLCQGVAVSSSKLRQYKREDLPNFTLLICKLTNLAPIVELTLQPGVLSPVNLPLGDGHDP